MESMNQRRQAADAENEEAIRRMIKFMALAQVYPEPKKLMEELLQAVVPNPGYSLLQNIIRNFAIIGLHVVSNRFEDGQAAERAKSTGVMQ